MAKTILKCAGIVLALCLVALLVTAPLPVAGAEGLDTVPVYEPVTLAATEVTPLSYEDKAPYEPHASGYLADDAGYLDDTLSVRIESFRCYDTDMRVAWVAIADPSQLRSASVATFPSKKTMNAIKLAKREKAVIAMNGDYIVYMNTGYSARNGEVLRSREKDKDAHDFDVLMIDDTGTFTIIQSMNADNIAAYNETHTLVHAYTFGPGLVVDGVKTTDINARSKPNIRAQRMAIAQMPDGTYAMVSTDGPDDKNSTGLTLYEFADVLEALGVQNAYNLDGGSSSWLVLGSTRLNGNHGSKHRDVADILFFVTASPEEAE